MKADEDERLVHGPPPKPGARESKFGIVAAKWRVRAGLKCECCYVDITACRKRIQSKATSPSLQSKAASTITRLDEDAFDDWLSKQKEVPGASGGTSSNSRGEDNSRTRDRTRSRRRTCSTSSLSLAAPPPRRRRSRSPRGEGDALRSLPSVAKAKQVVKWKLCVNNPCVFGKRCTFAHGVDELGQVAEYSCPVKVTLCRYWQAGSCTYGDSCSFAHGVEDLAETAAVVRSQGGEDFDSWGDWNADGHKKASAKSGDVPGCKRVKTKAATKSTASSSSNVASLGPKPPSAPPTRTDRIRCYRDSVALGPRPPTVPPPRYAKDAASSVAKADGAVASREYTGVASRVPPWFGKN